MPDEETTPPVKARGDSIEPTMTISNESGPVLFGPTGARLIHAPQPAEKVGIWEQIRQQIDPVSKVVSTLSSVLFVAWSVFLLVGGVFFLFYYGSIGFWPELDLKASVSLLAVSASTGTVILVMLGISLLGPAALWVSMIRTSPLLKRLWYDNEGKLLGERVVLWIVLPLWGVLGCPFAELLLVNWGVVGKGQDVFLGSWLAGLLVSGGLTLRCLLRKFDKQEWKAIGLFFLYFGLNFFLLLMLFFLVYRIMRAAVFSGTPALKALLEFAGVLFAIVLINGVIAAALSDDTKPWALRTSVPHMILIGVAISVVFMFMGGWTFISNGIMYQYKFGRLRDVSLILDDVGCAIVQGHGLQKKLEDLKNARCRLPGVMIHSRLGGTYYVEVDGARPSNYVEADGDRPSTRFTIPAQHVLSWMVTEPQKPRPAEAPQSTQNPASTRDNAPQQQ